MKKILLSRGLEAIVDDDDFERVNQWKWQAKPEHRNFYAIRSAPTENGKRTTIAMHRFIIGAGPCQQVDHRNGNGLDNRRFNLRICTCAENQFNTGPKSTACPYKGVSWHKRLRKWQARIRKDDVLYHLGYFSSAHCAAIVYNWAAERLFGQFCRLNEVKEQDIIREPIRMFSEREDVPA